MHWFRVHARIGGWLALSALVIQLVLAFGHVHAERGAPLVDTSIFSAASLADQTSAPAGPEPAADHDCAICVLLHIANSVVPTTAPSLALPLNFDRIHRIADVAPLLTASHHTLFRARAPPVA